MSLDTGRQTRCCARHQSYDELVAHLTQEFAELDHGTVAREVARADAAAGFTGLDEADDRLLMCELVARHQLQLRCGRATEIARLDPQTHTSPIRDLEVEQ
jgi:hypothetical protein